MSFTYTDIIAPALSDRVSIVPELSCDDIVINNDATISGICHISDTTDAQTTDTGALTVAGGIGVGKTVYAVTGIFDSRLYVMSTAGATTSGAGSIWCNGGMFVNNNEVVMSSTPASSSGAGALYCNGGLYVGSNEVVMSSTDSSSSDTGALTIVGGVGIGKTASMGTGFMLGTGPAICNVYRSQTFAGTMMGTAAISATMHIAQIGDVKVINGIASCTMPGATQLSVDFIVPGTISDPITTGAAFPIVVHTVANGWNIGYAQFDGAHTIKIYRDGIQTPFTASDVVTAYIDFTYI